MSRCLSSCVFFVQAEDGIRDLVRSRGLGDVYKRQHVDDGPGEHARLTDRIEGQRTHRCESHQQVDQEAVSYTHLTLPTSDLV